MALKTFINILRSFDSVTLFDNAIANTDEAVIPNEILYIVKNKLSLQSEIVPQWIQTIVDEFNMSGNLINK